MQKTVYLNGDFMPEEKAAVSPNDRGFLFADGVYEVLKYYHGKPFCLEEHMNRLKRSLAEIEINFPEPDRLKDVFEQLINKNQLGNTHAGVYLQITRGAAPRVHHFPGGLHPTVYAFAFDLPSFRKDLGKGIRVITGEDIRWLRCDIKSVALLPNTMLFNQAHRQGAGECILIRNGVVTEATHSSVFGVKNGTLLTHPLSPFILPGITRQVVLDICRREAIPMEERAITATELFELDELFITGTGTEVTPVIRVDDTSIGDQTPGPVTRLLQQSFFEMTA